MGGNHMQFGTASVLESQKAFQLTFRTQTFQPTFPLLAANLDFFYRGVWPFFSSLGWALWPATEVIRIGTIFNLSFSIRCLLQNSPVLWNDSFWGRRKKNHLLCFEYIKNLFSSLCLPRSPPFFPWAAFPLNWLKLCQLNF